MRFCIFGLRLVFFVVLILVFFMAIFSGSLSWPLGGYATKRFLLLLLLSGVFFYFLFFDNVFEVVRESWLWFFVSIIFLVASFRVGDYPYKWVEPGFYFLFFICVSFCAYLTRSNVYWFSWCQAIIACSGFFLYGLVSLIIYCYAFLDNFSDFSQYIPWGVVSIRYWSHIATWLLPILPIAVLIGPLKSERLWRLFVAMGAALWWWIVFLSTSRGTMVSVAFGVLLVVLLMGRPSFPWFKVFIRYLIYGAVAWFILSVLIPSVFLDDVSLRQIKSDTSGRMPLFIEAWRMSLVNFPFGMGPQSWLTHEVITEAYRNSPKFGHPHNMYLMWAAEYGWLLITAMLPLVGQAIFRFWKRRCEIRALGDGDERRIKAVSLAAFTASVSAALVHAGVSAVFMAPGSMLIGFLVLSVFWALISPDTPAVPSSPGSRRRIAAILVAGIAAVLWLLWFGEVLEYYQAVEADLKYYQENGSSGMLPRFWFHGNFPRAEG